MRGQHVYGGKNDQLRFDKNRKIKILQRTDLHWESNYGELDQYDEKTEKIIFSIMDLQKPNFVVVTGDIISGNTPDSPSVLKRALECIDKFNAPFSAVLGNHDVEQDKTTKTNVFLTVSRKMYIIRPSN